jgi:hypothetical protein
VLVCHVWHATVVDTIYELREVMEMAADCNIALGSIEPAKDKIEGWTDTQLGYVKHLATYITPLLRMEMDSIIELLASCHPEFALTSDGTPSFAEAVSALLGHITRHIAVCCALLPCHDLYSFLSCPFFFLLQCKTKQTGFAKTCSSHTFIESPFITSLQQEAYIVRAIKKDTGDIIEVLVQVKILEGASNSDGLADGHIAVIEELQLRIENWKAAMVDRAATNGAAITKVNEMVEGAQVLRASCFAHTVSHVGEKFKVSAVQVCTLSRACLGFLLFFCCVLVS